jgi:hypothetical protein
MQGLTIAELQQVGTIEVQGSTIAEVYEVIVLEMQRPATFKV